MDLLGAIGLNRTLEFVSGLSAFELSTLFHDELSNLLGFPVHGEDFDHHTVGRILRAVEMLAIEMAARDDIYAQVGKKKSQQCLLHQYMFRYGGCMDAELVDVLLTNTADKKQDCEIAWNVVHFMLGTVRNDVHRLPKSWMAETLCEQLALIDEYDLHSTWLVKWRPDAKMPAADSSGAAVLKVVAEVLDAASPENIDAFLHALVRGGYSVSRMTQLSLLRLSSPLQAALERALPMYAECECIFDRAAAMAAFVNAGNAPLDERSLLDSKEKFLNLLQERFASVREAGWSVHNFKGDANAWLLSAIPLTEVGAPFETEQELVEVSTTYPDWTEDELLTKFGRKLRRERVRGQAQGMGF